MSDTPVALVTGGSSGLGYAMAQRFAAGGYRVVITGRDEARLAAAAAALGPAVQARRCDLDELSGLPGFVAELKASLGRIDVLVNNAGINQKKPFESVTDADFARLFTTNQAAVFALSREVVGIMKTQPQRGNLIHISSMAAQFGIPQVISYTAAKTAVEGMTRAMAVELGPLGIRVNCVAPGFIETPMSAKALDNDPARKNRVLGRTPLGRLGQPAEVANAVFFLASEQAAFISGVTLCVDGGNSIGF